MEILILTKDTIMKTILILAGFFFASITMAQTNEIIELNKRKSQIQNQIKNLTDSVNKIENRIQTLQNNLILETVTDSTLIGIVREGAKLKKNPDPLAEPINALKAGTEVIILDYSNNYFGICQGQICGYMSEVWLIRDENIDQFVQSKYFEIQEIERVEKERNEKEKLEIENKFIKKYGEINYIKMKQGHFWIGMNKEMVTFSLGSPNKINRTVGPWGVHEQWVYSDNLYLYFENGKLTSYQN